MWSTCRHLFQSRWVSVHSVFVVVIVAIALGYAWKAPKQKYPFKGISGLGVREAVQKDKATNAAKKDGSPSVQGVPKQPRTNKSEEKCRAIFERLFRQSFPNERPQFLVNPVTGKRLELDGFCADLKTPFGRGLAFEYDGIQHSKFRAYFHKKGPKEFVYQQKRDTWKDLKCQAQGIVLIRIPHFIPPEAMEPYIKQKLRQKGINWSQP